VCDGTEAEKATVAEWFTGAVADDGSLDLRSEGGAHIAADVKSGGGSPEEIVEGLLGFARKGISHLQVWLAPNTPAGIEAFEPVLELLHENAISAA